MMQQEAARLKALEVCWFGYIHLGEGGWLACHLMDKHSNVLTLTLLQHSLRPHILLHTMLTQRCPASPAPSLCFIQQELLALDLEDKAANSKKAAAAAPHTTHHTHTHLSLTLPPPLLLPHTHVHTTGAAGP
jgi:hypothetical protein